MKKVITKAMEAQENDRIPWWEGYNLNFLQFKNLKVLIRIRNLCFCHSIKFTGLLTTIVLMFGAFLFHTENVYAQHKITWSGGFDGNYILDGVTDPYPQSSATYFFDKEETDIEPVATWSIDGGQETPLEDLGRDHWFGPNPGWPWQNYRFDRLGNDSEFVFVFVGWFVYNCKGIYCSYIRIIPNSRKLNDELKPGQTLTIKLVVEKQGKYSTLITTLKRPLIEVNWSESVETEGRDYAILNDENHTALTDVGGTMETSFNKLFDGGPISSINKWRFSLYEDDTPDTVDDVPLIDEAIYNNPGRKWNTDIVAPGVEEVTDLEGTETKVGNSTSSGTYGTWYIREADGYTGDNYLAHDSSRQFIFRPNPAVIAKMERGSSVRSYLRIQTGYCLLNLNLRPPQSDCTLGDYEYDEISDEIIIAVTINKLGPATVSIDDVSLAEDTGPNGAGSTRFRFTVSLSSSTALNQSFSVPLKFVHSRTDRADFVNDPLASTPASVEFGTDDTEKTIDIMVNQDHANEPDETFWLIIFEPTGNAKDMDLVTLSSVEGENVGLGTITNDDAPSALYTFNWSGNFTGTITADSSTTDYGFVQGEWSSSTDFIISTTPNYATYAVETKGAVETKELRSDQNEAFTSLSSLNNSNTRVFGKDKFKYGLWYTEISTQSCGSSFCFDVVFLPNKDEINKLGSRDTVTSRLFLPFVTPTDGRVFVETVVTINGPEDTSEVSMAWLSRFDGAISSNESTNSYPHQIALLFDNSVTLTAEQVAVEMKNEVEANRSTGSHGNATGIDGFTYPELTIRAGTDTKIVSDSFTYGTWYSRQIFPQDNIVQCQVFCSHILFVPNPSAIDQLAAGDTVTSSYTYTLTGTSSQVVDSETVTVTITRDLLSAVSITIESVSPLVMSGENAEFSVTSTPAPPIDLKVALNVSATPMSTTTDTIGQTEIIIEANQSSAMQSVSTNSGAVGTISAVLSSPSTNYTIGTNSSASLIVTDQDVPAISVTPVADSVIEGTVAVFKITASPASSIPMTVNYTLGQTAGGSVIATPPSTDPNLTIGANSVDFATGQSEIMVTVATESDTTDEGVANVEIAIDAASSGSVYTIGTSSTAQVEVWDDDGKPLIVFESYPESAFEGETISITVKSIPAVPTGTTFTVDTEISEVAGDSLLQSPPITKSASFSEGDVTKAITVETQNNGIANRGGTITAELQADATNFDLSSKTQISITIDDSNAMPTIRVDTTSLQEGEANPMIAVNLVPPATTDDISVDYVISSGANGTATEGASGDFMRKTGTLMFDNDDSTASVFNDRAAIPLTIYNDSNYELAETFEVTLSNLQGSNVQLPSGQSSVTSTITINEEAGELKPMLSVPNTIEVWKDIPGGTVTIPVTLTGTSHETITVAVETSATGGTATPGTDYNEVSSTVHTIPPGNLEYDIELPNTIIDNPTTSGDKTFKVVLKNATNTRNSLSATPLETTVTIKDIDGSTPTLSFELDANNEIVVNDDVSSSMLTVTVLLSAATDVTVNYRTEDVPGEAVAGTDYTATSGSFEIKNGATSGTFDISIANISGAAEKFFNVVIDTADSGVRLRGGGNATVADGNGGQRPALSQKVKIVNADQPVIPTITVSRPNGTVAEGDTLTYDFTLSGPTGGNVSITPSVSEDSTAGPKDYVVVMGDFNGTTAQLTITVEDDRIYEYDETIVLTLTAVNAEFSAGVKTHPLTVTITDNESKPVLSILDTTQSVSEGLAAKIRVKSSIETERPVSVGYTVADAGRDFFDMATSDPNPKSMTFGPLGSEYIDELTIGTKSGVGAGSQTRVITVTLDTPQSAEDYEIDSTAATATVEVLDHSVPVISVSSGSLSVMEGEDIEIVLASNPAPTTDIDVGLRVTQDGDYLIWPVRRTVRFDRGSRSVELNLSSAGDPESNGSGTVTVAVIDGNGYKGGRPVSVEVRKPVPDNTGATKYSVASSVITMILQKIPPTQQENRNVAKSVLSIRAVKETVEEGETALFAISTSHAVNSGIPVKIVLSQSGDFVIGPMVRSVELKKDRFEAELSVDTENDELAEDDGIITATIQDGNGYNVGSVKTAYVNVSDALDRLHRKSRVSNALHAVLPDLLAHSTNRTLGIAMERATHAFSGNATTSIELNGQPPVLSMLQTGGEMLNTGDADWQSLIDESAFSIALYPEGGEISSASVWGVGDRQSLSGEGNAGQQSWKGESLSGHFGFDARVGNSLLAGLSLSVSQSEIGYGRIGDSGMSFDTNTTGVHPYLGLNFPDGKSHLQIMAGYGVNELVLSQEAYSPEFLRGSYQTVGFSGNRRILSNSFWDGHNLELSVSGEAWNSNQYLTEVEGFVDDLQISARHARIAIEGVHDYNLSGGGTFSPSISIGLREDGRNEESIFGLDFSSGIGYGTTDGLEVHASGKSLLSGLNRVHWWEIENSVNFDSGNDDKGVLFKMSQTWNGTDANTDRYIWGSELVNASDDSISSRKKSFFSTEIGYGFDVLGGSALMVPYVGFNQGKSHGSEIRVGSRISTNKGHKFELEIVREIPETGTLGHEVNLTGNINW